MKDEGFLLTESFFIHHKHFIMYDISMEYKRKKYYITALGYYARDVMRNGVRKTYHLHRIIWEEYHGPIPKGFHVHHKDGNRLNNEIKNLDLMPQPQHASLHRKGEWASGKLNYLLEGQKKFRATEEGKKIIHEAVKRGWLKRKLLLKTCIWCKKEFKTKAPQAKLCSTSCRYKKWWHKEG